VRYANANPGLSADTSRYAVELAGDALRRANDALRRRVRGFPANALDAPLVPEPAYTAYMRFIGITQHDLVTMPARLRC